MSIKGLINTLNQSLSLYPRILHHTLLLQNLNTLHHDHTSKWITSKSGSMRTRCNSLKNFLASQNGTHWIESSRKSLTKADHVCLDSIMLLTKHFSSSSTSSLNFINHQQNIVFITKFSHFRKIIIIRNNDSSLTLNGLYHVSSHMRILLEILF